jgi:thiol-disulfide isomerase/thioredoxin
MIRAHLEAALILFVLGCAVAGNVEAAEFRDFDAKSVVAIRAAHAGRPFILAFWSIYCEPCREEMSQWGPLQRRNPAVPILLVATDPPRDRALLAKLLSGFDLAGVQTWAYADEFEERVRFAVDRAWGGELPRTYLFDAEHHVEARSGPADPAWIESWLRKQTTTSK